MNRHAIGVFSFCALVSGVAAAPSEASAFWRSQSAYYCVPLGAVDTTSPNFSLENPSCSNVLGVVCGVPNDTNFSHNSITDLHVRGYANGAASGGIGVAAYACISYYGAAGGACGTGSVSAAAGWYDLTPSVSPWGGATSTDDAPYVYTILGHGTGGVTCNVFNTIAAYKVSG